MAFLVHQFCRARRLAARAALLGMAWLCLLAAGSRSAGGDNASPSKEYQIKAAFVYNFTKYVEWTPDALGGRDTPFVIAVVGTNPFGDELRKAVEDRRLNGRPFVIRNLASAGDLQGVHVVYVADSEAARYGALLRSIGPRPLLTIGEGEGFLREGGIISFVLEGDKVRFLINMDAAESAGLHISAQLQKLAVRIQKKP